MPTLLRTSLEMVFANFLSSITKSTLILLGPSDPQWNGDWSYRNRKRMTVGGCRQDGTHLRHPVAFRSTCEECSCIFRSSWRGEFSQPEWGIITALVNTARVSWMIGILSASQDERFQRTPARHTDTEFWDGHSSPFQRVFPHLVNSMGRLDKESESTCPRAYP